MPFIVMPGARKYNQAIPCLLIAWGLNLCLLGSVYCTDDVLRIESLAFWSSNAVVLKWGYAYLKGYARVTQGVREYK